MGPNKQQTVFRVLIYVAGLIILSTGISLSTKTGLGISTVTAPCYAVSQSFGWNFSLTIFVPYAFMVIAQFIIKGKKRTWRDLLQFPVSIAFSSFVGCFGFLIPIHFEHLWQNLILMAVGVVLTGVGIAMMVDMQIVPNPPDGLVDAISVAVNKDMGLIKNILDACCVVIALFVDLVFNKALVSVGIGTIFAMIFIGRTVAVFNRFFKVKIQRTAGLA